MILAIILGVLGYLTIGAFFCGLVDEGDSMGVWIVLWPIIIVGIVLGKCLDMVSDCGYIIRDAILSYFEKE